MEPHILTADLIRKFGEQLTLEERSPVTVRKYLSDAGAFLRFCAGEVVSRALVLRYKELLISRYTARSVNSMLAALSSLFRYLGWEDCRVRSIKIQQQAYIDEERELTKAEYLRLLDASRSNTRLNLILQTLCGTGIRVSELNYFTVEALHSGTISVRCKGKTRNVFVPDKLRKLLLHYASSQKITSGYIFRTRGGLPVSRSNIWAEMKKLCSRAQVNPSKVFPHNLRKLFARTFYGIEKDLAKLADLLGHSSISTTRIYIMTTGVEHRKKIERLGLIQ